MDGGTYTPVLVSIRDWWCLLSQIPIDVSQHQHQTLLFSASWSNKVQSLAAEILRPNSVVRVAVGAGRADQLAANSAILQRVEVLPVRGKLPLHPKDQERIDSDKLERLISEPPYMYSNMCKVVFALSSLWSILVQARGWVRGRCIP